MRFTKMEGLGNDYIYVSLFTEKVEKPEELAVRIADRHFGVGSDGLVLIAPSETADVRMIMYNADGSRGKMCGNASRCIGKYVYERGLVRKEDLLLETDSGIRPMHLQIRDGRVMEVTVDLGEPILDRPQIPCTFDSEGKTVPVRLDDREFAVTPVGVGNAHAVVFLRESVDTFDLARYGSLLERYPAFPEKTNAEFVNVISPDHLRMRVWERGSGITMACGTGAGASAVAGMINGFTGPNVRVSLDGGDLSISIRDGHVFMTGPAAFVCDGVYPAE
ncbi:MAG: diaminopimelate epimerase [Clostridia bacterium]|nr:diaminopimelate epimerase [Clostridia bacterium]